MLDVKYTIDNSITWLSINDEEVIIENDGFTNAEWVDDRYLVYSFSYLIDNSVY